MFKKDDIIQAASAFLDYIYKKRCYFCGSSKECIKMCSKCYEELQYSDFEPDRVILGINVYSAGVYEKNLQKMIRGLKYHKQKDLAFYIAKFMYGYFMSLENLNPDTQKYQVVPVPLHIKREKKRGYNQMKLVSDEFCKLCAYVPNYGLVKRTKETKPQYNLNYKERMDNLSGAFEVDLDKYINELPVLLIDDICSTGASFMSIISVLREKGINNITCFTISSPRYNKI